MARCVAGWRHRFRLLVSETRRLASRRGAMTESENIRARHFRFQHFRSRSALAYTRSPIVACHREKREELLPAELRLQLLLTALRSSRPPDCKNLRRRRAPLLVEDNIRGNIANFIECLRQVHRKMR